MVKNFDVFWPSVKSEVLTATVPAQGVENDEEVRLCTHGDELPSADLHRPITTSQYPVNYTWHTYLCHHAVPIFVKSYAFNFSSSLSWVCACNTFQLPYSAVFQGAKSRFITYKYNNYLSKYDNASNA